ncbi:hypothetical protein KEJ26_05970 [Candidatus Bathyarchaeota archaeon]|nr:hypothetical protein [Candidatus Bathyarchaeota archaeon]
MSEQIAIVTLSGRAYYKLVSELKQKHLPFLSLRPTDAIPPNVKVIITTSREHLLPSKAVVLLYESEDPSEVVNQAVRVLLGKRRFDRVIVGVDPGKTYGVAVVGDEKNLEMTSFSDAETAATWISNFITKIDATQKIVRIGDGAEAHRDRLLSILNKQLPFSIALESVSESGTTRSAKEIFTCRRGLRDAASAMKIARRSGQRIERRRHV